MNNLERSENHSRPLLRRGLSAWRVGDHAEARRWFRAALDTDPDNTIALLWLAWLAPSRQESLVLLGRVLELDPKNDRARAGIRWARRRPSTSQDSPTKHPQGDTPGSGGVLAADQTSAGETPSPLPTPWLPGRTDRVRDALQSPKAEESARSGVAAHRAQRLVGPLGLLLAVAVCLFAAGAGLVARYSPATVLAWMLPTPSPTVTPTLTSTSTPTVSPTATATPTPTPNLTPTATATNPPTHTPSSELTLPDTPPPSPTFSPVPGSEKWIDVDLTHQRVTAYEGSTPVFQATVSTGLPNTPTVVGQFRIYLKLSATAMAGPGYYLPGVPYTMYFHRGYALHGTYWHDNFGQPMSHGCVNLRTEDAQWFFNWADPHVPAGASQVRSSDSDPGTLVVVHY